MQTSDDPTVPADMNSGMNPDVLGGPPPEELFLVTGAGCVVYVALLVFVIAGYWKVFSKAGLMGVSAIVPIWNLISCAQTAKMPWWYGLLLLIPFVNIIVAVMMCIGISKAFGRGAGTAIGLFLLTPIFAMILGFGSAEYDGEASSFG